MEPQDNRFEKIFDNMAAVYDKVRPMYAEEIFRDIFRYKKIDENSNVLEVGAGTGKATRPFLETGCSVCALEPGITLAEIASERFRDFDNFSICMQTLQEYEHAMQFDLIYSATAFHWIPEEYGYNRVYELLKDGGVFARFAYHAGPDQSRPKLTEEIQQLYRIYMNSTKSPKVFDEMDAGEIAAIAEKYGFKDVEYRLYHRTKDFTAEEYTELLKTYPDHMRLEVDKREALFRGIYDAIKRHGGILTVYYVMDLELARK